jgi:hypothetical protein
MSIRLVRPAGRITGFVQEIEPDAGSQVEPARVIDVGDGFETTEQMTSLEALGRAYNWSQSPGTEWLTLIGWTLNWAAKAWSILQEPEAVTALITHVDGRLFVGPVEVEEGQAPGIEQGFA